MSISRRQFLALGGIGLASLGLSSLAIPKLAFGATKTVSDWDDIAENQSVWISSLKNADKANVTVNDSRIEFIPAGTLIEYAGGSTWNYALGIKTSNLTTPAVLSNASGLYSVRFKNAGELADGSKVDVLLTCTRVEFTQGVDKYENFPWYTMLIGYQSLYNGFHSCHAMTQDVTVSILKTGTNTKASIPDGYWFKYDDVDVPGGTNGWYGTGGYNWSNQAEGIQLLSNYGDVYLYSGTLIQQSTVGGNPTFVGSQRTDEADRVRSNTVASIIVKAKQDYSFRWSGYGCGTTLNASFQSVEQPKYGGLKLQKSDRDLT